MIHKIERNRSFKIFPPLTEGASQVGRSAAVHPQRMIPLPDIYVAIIVKHSYVQVNIFV
ncbi:MAG: hypothetical protein ABSH34_22990 [Verrucomicrobiota bacterium]|jgi:hypothetical protein